MFAFDVFAEVMVVGGLLLLSLSPLFVRLSSWAKKEGFVPAVDYLKEGTGRFAIALLVAYTLGVAGNRLVDDGLDQIIDPGSEYKTAYKTWAAERPTQPQSIKVAEFWLRSGMKLLLHGLIDMSHTSASFEAPWPHADSSCLP
jgi:hypothetical protein